MKDTDSDFVNVAVYLAEAARQQPYTRAVISPAGRDKTGNALYTHLTFRQLDRESDCLAHGLVAAGIRRGIRTILMVKPGPAFFALTFALFKVGAVPVVVDPGMGVKRMLACLKESRATALIGIPPAHALRTLYPKFFQSVKIAVTVGRKWFWKGFSFGDIRKTPWKRFPIAETARDETAAILFTTGSTGPAKGVVYTHGIFDAQLTGIRDHFDIQPGEIDLPTYPLFALFDPALGMTAVIPDMDPTQPARVDPRKIIEAVLRNGVTNMFASPALLNRVGRFGRDNGIRLPSLKRVISAGAPVLPEILECFSCMLNDDTQIFPGYGATEAMPVAAVGSHEVLSKTRQLSEKGFGICVGYPIDGVTVKIIRINDDPIAEWSENLALPEGEIGEIAVQGERVTREYFRRPGQDRLGKIPDGDTIWHRMGDLGWFDGEGRLWFCGRKSHRVVTAKETLFTVPCEAIFNNHPDVFRSALVGVGPAGNRKPVICLELEKNASRIRMAGAGKKKLLEDLSALAKGNVMTAEIDTFLFHKSFPVDIRHNSKIFREKLAVWAQKKLG
ncbi:MAG: AMP-binding protein [Deltaproteobacteria bacterium]|nr:AMP-binding protein [Deltaproteobacteria bacterium]